MKALCDSLLICIFKRSIKGGYLWGGTLRVAPPLLFLYIIHISTVPAMQSIFGVRLGGVLGGGLGCAWMDERWETGVGQRRDALQFSERLIFLVLCVPI